MHKFVIVGGKRLEGTIRVSGAKNSALPILAASLLSPGENCLEQIPRLEDVRVMLHLLDYLGAKVTQEQNRVVVHSGQVKPQEVTEELMRRMRASNLLMGPLLGRFGYVRVSHPGGCNPQNEIPDRQVN